MKKFLLTALTSLFVGVMPLSAAYSQAAPEECNVASVSLIINDEVRAGIEKQGGQMFDYTTPETLVPVLNALTKDMGAPPPFEFDAIYVSHPAPEARVVNIAFAKGNCIVNVLRRPFLPYATLFEKI